MMSGRSILIGFLPLLVTAPPFWGKGAIDFGKDIQPILEANCSKCHGPEKQKAKMRLDTPAFIRKGGDSGEPPSATGQPMISVTSR